MHSSGEIRVSSAASSTNSNVPQKSIPGVCFSCLVCAFHETVYIFGVIPSSEKNNMPPHSIKENSKNSVATKFSWKYLFILNTSIGNLFLCSNVKFLHLWVNYVGNERNNYMQQHINFEENRITTFQVYENSPYYIFRNYKLKGVGPFQFVV